MISGWLSLSHLMGTAACSSKPDITLQFCRCCPHTHQYNAHHYIIPPAPYTLAPSQSRGFNNLLNVLVTKYVFQSLGRKIKHNKQTGALYSGTRIHCNTWLGVLTTPILALVQGNMSNIDVTCLKLSFNTKQHLSFYIVLFF